MSDRKQLIDAFQKYVYERNLTLRQVATLLVMSQAAISRILNGTTSRPHPRTLYKIKKILGEL